MIRLLIAAPSTVMRSGLEALAASNPEWQVVASFADLAALEDFQPDVVLAAMPVSALPPGNVPIVLLTNEPEPEWSIEAVRAGVRALLPRDASSSQIVAAVEASASGMAVVEPRALNELLSSSLPAAAHVEGSALTPREVEVLQMLAEGAANKLIAWKLGISEHTAKFHVASILGKLGASSRTEAVTIGIRRGLILL